jgi:hypothetical protein
MSYIAYWCVRGRWTSHRPGQSCSPLPMSTTPTSCPGTSTLHRVMSCNHLAHASLASSGPISPCDVCVCTGGGTCRREAEVDVVTIRLHPVTGVCLAHLAEQLEAYADRKLKIGAFAAASNVTGEPAVLIHSTSTIRCDCQRVY